MMDTKNKKSKTISLITFEEHLECLRATLENTHVCATEELEKAAMTLTPEEENEHHRRQSSLATKSTGFCKQLMTLRTGNLPKFDPDDPKISNLFTLICALEFHLQDNQPPKCWYKARITSIVNPSAKAWASQSLFHLDLPGTPWTSIKAIFFNPFVLQSSNFVAYKKLRYLQAGPIESVDFLAFMLFVAIVIAMEQQGHLAFSCPNKTNKNSSGLFALTTGYNNDDPPIDVHDNDDDDDPPATAIHSGPPHGPSATLSYLQCDDVDSYYEYCRDVNELVEDSLDYDPYG
ncbi:hypothetical protein QOT17_017232 [Balamuthia mandrillaris]